MSTGNVRPRATTSRSFRLPAAIRTRSSGGRSTAGRPELDGWMIGPLRSVSGAMVSDAGRDGAPGHVAHETNGRAVRSRAQMAGRARATIWNHRVAIAVAGLLVALCAGVAI